MTNPYVLLILTALIYAANILVGKVVTAEIPPFTLAFLRCCIAIIFLFPLGFREVRANLALWKKEWKPLIGLAFTGIALFNALTYFSVTHTSSINAGIIEGTLVIFSIILGYIFLKEKLTNKQFLGVAISLCGVVWVITKGSVDVLLTLSFNIGDLTMLLAMLTWAVYSVLVKQHTWKFPVYGGVLMLIAIGAICLIPLALFELHQFAHIQWTLPVSLGLLFLGIFPSVIAFIFWNKAVAMVGPAISSIFLNLIPVFTAVGAILFLDEAISLLQILGGIIVLLGVFITTIENVKKTKPVGQKELEL